MKIFIQYDSQNKSGKGKFLSRLIPELQKLGCKCTYSTPESCDITLGITRWREKVRTKKRVLRVDGVYMTQNKANLKTNKRIYKSILKSDAVVFQSGFAKQKVEEILQIQARKSYIIFNGADPEKYKVENPLSPKYSTNIISSAKWISRDSRSHKRLYEIYDIANKYTKVNEDVCFWIAGANDLDISYTLNSRIKILGKLDEKELRRYLAMCGIYLHIPYYSWCDNSLVEAICAGCVPVGTDVGGNAEVITACGGVILPLDEPVRGWIKKSPPPFNGDLVIEAIHSTIERPPFITTIPVSIDNIAKEYYKVFEEVLK